MVDYLTRADVWGSPTCITAQFPTVAVIMPVNVDPANHAVSTYTLRDEIALRNGDVCP